MHTLTTVSRSSDGTVIHGAAMRHKQYSPQGDGLQKALPRAITNPTLGHKIKRWFLGKRYNGRASGFLGLDNQTAHVLSKGGTYGLTRERTKKIVQTQPTLPRANRPPAKITRGTEYRLHVGGKTVKISGQAYKQLRGYGKRR